MRRALAIVAVSSWLCAWLACGGDGSTGTADDAGASDDASQNRGDEGILVMGDAATEDAPTADASSDGGASANGSDGLPRDDAGLPYFWNGQQAYIKASNTNTCGIHTYCNFGQSVALSADGNTLAVGSPAESSPSTGINGSEDGTKNDLAEASGAVYVYRRTGTTWAQEAYVKASNTGKNNGFGGSVSLSADGNILVVGAAGESGASSGIDGDETQMDQDEAGVVHSESGAVYVFTRVGTTWSQETYIKASNAQYATHFGTSVSVSGDGKTLAVGAPDERSNATTIDGNQADISAMSAGAAYVFLHGAGTWTQQAYVKAWNGRAGAFFGASVSLSSDGNALAVGAYGEEYVAQGVNPDGGVASNQYHGAAYTFSRAGAAWTKDAYFKATDAMSFEQPRFGFAVAMSGDGNRLAVGAWVKKTAYVFGRPPGGAWAAQGKPLVPAGGNQFGWSLALSYDGTRLVVGDPGGETASGLTYDNGVWSFRQSVVASNEHPGTLFGSSVAVSQDARTLAVGSKWELSSSSGINGDQSPSSTAYGAAYVFQ